MEWTFFQVRIRKKNISKTIKGTGKSLSQWSEKQTEPLSEEKLGLCFPYISIRFLHLAIEAFSPDLKIL